MPTIDELWNVVKEQQKEIQAHREEIQALRKKRHRAPVSRRGLALVATVIAAVALSGAAFAAGPVSANLVHGCYSPNTRALTLARVSGCPKGTVAIAWNQFTAITASKPLTVTPGVRGSAPNVTLTGTVPTARSFTGSLTGDVRGTQGTTKVGAIQGVPVSRTTPSNSQLLGFNGTTWTPTSVYDPRQVALLKWYSEPAGWVPASVTVGTGPWGVAFDGSHIWVANESTGNVSEIDVAGHTVINTVTVGGNPIGVAFDGSHIWVSNVNDTVSEISDTPTPTVINTVTVGSDPGAVAFDGSHIWVSNDAANTVSEIDVATHSVINTVTVGPLGGRRGMAFDGSHVWVANDGGNTVSEIADTANPSVINTVTVGRNPQGVAFDGSHIWVANGASTVSEIDVATRRVINTVTVGPNPGAVAFDGSHIWAASDDNTVSEIEVATHSVINTVNVGSTPFGIAFDGSHIWVTNFGGTTVSIL